MFRLKRSAINTLRPVHRAVETIKTTASLIQVDAAIEQILQDTKEATILVTPVAVGTTLVVIMGVDLLLVDLVLVMRVVVHSVAAQFPVAPIAALIMELLAKIMHRVREVVIIFIREAITQIAAATTKTVIAMALIVVLVIQTVIQDRVTLDVQVLTQIAVLVARALLGTVTQLRIVLAALQMGIASVVLISMADLQEIITIIAVAAPILSARKIHALKTIALDIVAAPIVVILKIATLKTAIIGIQEDLLVIEQDALKEVQDLLLGLHLVINSKVSLVNKGSLRSLFHFYTN